ncbi:hypothetical protein CHY08_34175 (plasmid) [Rhizobium leguminosarum bv. viciae]|uniref:hypothetical protein n=1 Tax=Rhizobium leguminosarum TaxID=384 RepID=UPI000B8C9CB2|nr:hypothetical protein [Rhizobium leguminosarum]ASR12105.1 hypothetical protein CHY08_34175 [Rhizobium leguminosarum bv. viciae]
MTECIIRAFGGCACKDGECAERPVTPAPLIFISWRTQAATCLFIGALAAFLSAAVMEPTLKFTDLVNQEQYHADRN